MTNRNIQQHARYAPGLNFVKRFYLSETLNRRISLTVSEVTLEESILEDSLQKDFSCFEKLSRQFKLSRPSKPLDEIKFSSDSSSTSEIHECDLPIATQAFVRYRQASESFDDLVHSSQMSASTRFRALLDVQKNLTNAILLLETALRRSNQASRAGRKSHSQSDEIKKKSLTLLSDLCPQDGWQSMHQAASAIYRVLLPEVKAMRGRLSPSNFEERLTRWLNDTSGDLNARYHELKRKRRG